MMNSNIIQVFVVTLLVTFINATSNGGEELPYNEVVLNLKTRVSELLSHTAHLQIDIQRLNVKNKELLESQENCTGLLDQTDYISESLKQIQFHVNPLKSYVQERFHSNKNEDEDKTVQQFGKEFETVNLTAVAAEVNHITQSVQTFLQKCQTDTQAKVPSPPFKKIRNKYYYIEKEEELNWFAAAQKCRSLGGNLVNFESAEEFDLLKANLLDRRYWTSGNDLAKEGQYYSTATGKPIPYTRWSNAQPDNHQNNEDCIEIVNYPPHLMNDYDCEGLLHFICEAKL